MMTTPLKTVSFLGSLSLSSFQSLFSGHYQGGVASLGKITPPRTDPIHRKIGPLAQKSKILLHFTSLLPRAPPAGFPLFPDVLEEKSGKSGKFVSAIIDAIFNKKN